jgi:hypothetical protein
VECVLVTALGPPHRPAALSVHLPLQPAGANSEQSCQEYMHVKAAYKGVQTVRTYIGVNAPVLV